MFKLAGSVGLAYALAELRQRIRRGVRGGMLGVIAAVLFIIAVCFFLVALYLWLAGVLNPIASAAIIGGGLLLIALILFAVAASMFKGPARAEPPKSIGAELGNALRGGMDRLSAAASSSQSPLNNPLLQAVGLAIVVGFLLGRKSSPKKD